MELVVLGKDEQDAALIEAMLSEKSSPSSIYHVLEAVAQWQFDEE